MTVLAIEGLTAGYGLLHAVRDFSLQLQPRERVAVVGANGAGKTTLMRTIAGAHPVVSGSILFEGRNVTQLPSFRRAAAGIALVPEGRRLFPDMTVEENLMLAGQLGRKGAWTLEAVMEAFPNLKPRRTSAAGLLSGGEQQATAIGRALMTNPKVLLMDEVSLGLSPLAVNLVYASLETLKQTDTAIVVVEQDLTRAFSFATRILCMLEGKVVLEGSPQTLSRQQVTDAFFGLGRAEVPA